ncbi:hypothetical protein QFW77_09995 [Luteimonas sp. RD2P54]|uniref:GNAT family N-acetyltransferase n=1 Tax=Luteimonas endophytica TaxID=3042023 RepID=A0ABT6J929_9GAMM|nr:hypothetical protein [Luteimonas endophytica]MDH5823314.1 hypothetical protein [Luteimonas endophytica]
MRAVRREEFPALLALCEAQSRVDGGAAGAPGAGRGYASADPIELHEALFDPPLRAWAWLASMDGRYAGYAGASAGCSLPDRRNYLRLESLFVQPGTRDAAAVERRLFLHALRAADTLDCASVRWHLPAAQADRLREVLPAHAVRTDPAHYLLPVRGAAG